MIGRAPAAVQRASLEPLLVRLGVFAAGLAALVMAAPDGPPGLVVFGQVLLAALPALLPRGAWVTVVALAAVTGWLVDTGLTAGTLTGSGTGTGGQVTEPGRLLVLAGALYLLHSLAALAATLPYDAVVAPDVLTRTLVRALGVVVASTLLSVAVLAGLRQVTVGRGYALATIGGLVVAVGVAALLRSRHRGATIEE